MHRLQAMLIDQGELKHAFLSNDPQASIATVRHDLRNPMNAIKGYAEMIHEELTEQNDTVNAVAVESVLRQTANVLIAIDALQNSAKPESGQAIISSLDTINTTVVGNSLAGVTGRILIVDDIQSNREVLRKNLQSQGHEVVDVDGGKAALDLLQSQDVDLVLLDILMPELDGYQVLGKIKADRKLKHVPVIVISALDEMASVIKCIEAGAEDYLSKPFDPTLLKARISNCLEKKCLRDETETLLNRLEAELQDARKAQLAMVPRNFSEQSKRAPVSVYGSMRPAREVGGDFYDFFFTGDDDFWFMVGDVSDKGVASGMFMSKTMALARLIPCQVYAQSGRVLLPHELLQTLNLQLCELNEEMTFVTMVIGCLNNRSGRLWLANAGHSDALRINAAGTVELCGSNRGRPLGIRDDSNYESAVISLRPGEGTFLYTDGVTDAVNASAEFFGESRLFNVLADASGTEPENLVQQIETEVDRFSGDEEQFDDITMLAVQWPLEAVEFKEIKLHNSIDEVGRVCTEVLAYFAERAVSDSVAKDLVIVADEVLSNIVNYGYSIGDKGRIQLRIVVESEVVSLQFEDDGKPFDPLKQSATGAIAIEDPPNVVPDNLEDIPVGGLGLRFLQGLTDRQDYQRKSCKNILTVIKRWEL